MRKNKFMIFQPSKSAMQSGLANINKWCLSNSLTNETFVNSVFAGLEHQTPKNLTLFFDTFEAAKRFAESKKLDFEIIKSKKKEKLLKNHIQKILLSSYA